MNRIVKQETRRKYDDDATLAAAIDAALGTAQTKQTLSPREEKLQAELKTSWEHIKKRSEHGETVEDELLALRVHAASQQHDDNQAIRTAESVKAFKASEAYYQRMMASQPQRGQSVDEFAVELEEINARSQKAWAEAQQLADRSLKTSTEVYR